MNISEILHAYGIDIPEDCYYLEHMLSEERGRICYLDRVPKAVPAAGYDKFDQFDILYREAMQSAAEREKFAAVEIRFLNVFEKLWLYSDVFIGVDDFIAAPDALDDYIDPQHAGYKAELEECISTKQLYKVEEIDRLHFFVCMGLRGAAFVNLYFREFDLLVTSTWSCFSFCFLKADKFAETEKIAASEGLFLRKAE